MVKKGQIGHRWIVGGLCGAALLLGVSRFLILLGRATEQRELIAHIESLRGSVAYDYQLVEGPPGKSGDAFSLDGSLSSRLPSSLLGLLTEDFFHDVVHVSLRKTQLVDANVAMLRQFPGLVSVDLAETGVTDAALQYLKNLPLRALCHDNTRVTGAGLVHVAGFTNLEELGLWNTHVEDSELLRVRLRVRPRGSGSRQTSDSAKPQLPQYRLTDRSRPRPGEIPLSSMQVGREHVRRAADLDVSDKPSYARAVLENARAGLAAQHRFGCRFEDQDAPNDGHRSRIDRQLIEVQLRQERNLFVRGNLERARQPELIDAGRDILVAILEAIEKALHARLANISRDSPEAPHARGGHCRGECVASLGNRKARVFPFHSNRVSSSCRTPVSRPISALAILNVEQGDRRSAQPGSLNCRRGSSGPSSWITKQPAWPSKCCATSIVEQLVAASTRRMTMARFLVIGEDSIGRCDSRQEFLSESHRRCLRPPNARLAALPRAPAKLHPLPNSSGFSPPEPAT